MKNNSRKFIIIGLLVLAAMALTACQGEIGPQGPQGEQGPQGPQGPKGDTGEVSLDDLTCTECHNDGAEMAGIAKEWEESKHATGDAYVRGASGRCAGCHSSDGFNERVATGVVPTGLENGDTHPVGTDCRACHQIHTTYTGEDFTLTTSDPVAIFTLEGVTYDQGEGNLCASCHQPMSAFTAEDGMVNVSSTHWGPHHGAESIMLLGVGGAGVEGSPSMHYDLVEDGCVTCHMGEGSSHTYEPDTDNCVACHGEDIDSFDVDGAQTRIAELADQLLVLLIENGLYAMEDPDPLAEAIPADLYELLLEAGLAEEPEGHPVVGEYTEEQAAALWNYIFVVEEDGSFGVHNSDYAEALLQYGIDVLSALEPAE